MIQFTTVEIIGEHPYTLHCYMGEEPTPWVKFHCNELEGIRTDTLHEMLQEIKKKEDADKAGFVNPKAYMVQVTYSTEARVVEVLVTSIRDARTVWANYGKGIHATSRHRLYASREALTSALAFKKDSAREVEKRFAALDPWVPIPKDAAP